LVAKTVASKKARGRNLQNLIAAELMELFEEFAFDEIKPAIMGESGVDIKMSPLARSKIPWDIECKNQETWSIPAWWKQTTTNTGEGRKPLLVVKKNRHEPLVVMRWSDFKELIR
jgi:homoserine kinase